MNIADLTIKQARELAALYSVELTEEDAAILRELIAERKAEKANRELMQSFRPKACKHGVGVWHHCGDCLREYDAAKNSRPR